MEMNRTQFRRFLTDKLEILESSCRPSRFPLSTVSIWHSTYISETYTNELVLSSVKVLANVRRCFASFISYHEIAQESYIEYEKAVAEREQKRSVMSNVTW